MIHKAALGPLDAPLHSLACSSDTQTLSPFASKRPLVTDSGEKEEDDPVLHRGSSVRSEGVPTKRESVRFAAAAAGRSFD